MSSFSEIGEALIEEAIANGSLTPPPPGTKLDLEGYFRTPEGHRAGHAMLKGHGFVPPEIEGLKQAAALEERLASTTDPDMRRQLRRQIEEHRTRFRMAIEALRLRSSGPP